MATLTRRHDPKQSDLARRVRNFLHKQSAELHRVEVEVDHDTVVVKGSVPNTAARQLAETCCSRVAGVRRVVNEATVSKA